MDYYSCSYKDFCCYQHMRLASGSSPTGKIEPFGKIDGHSIHVVRDEFGRIVISDELMRELIERASGSSTKEGE